MSKNTSPQARPSRKLRGRKRDSAAKGVEKRARSAASATPSVPERDSNAARVREFLPLALIANVIIVSALIVLALAGLLMTNSSFVALPASIAQLWLISTGAPVASDTADLGFVPLLPALGVIGIIAWRVYSVVKERVSLADLYVLAACIVGVPVLLTLTALAMLADAATVLPVGIPNVALALGRTMLVHLAALLIGMGPRLWRALERRYVPESGLFDTALLAVKFWAGLLGASLVVLVGLLGAHAGTVGEIYTSLQQPGSVAGLTALSVLYLPNLLISIAFVLLGGEFLVADGAISLFGIYLVPLPPLPILGAVPGSVWSFAWVFLLIPLVVAAIVLYRHLGVATRPFRDVGLAGLWSVLFAAVLLALTIGELGGYGVVGPLWWLGLLSAPVWLWGAGLIIASVGAILRGRKKQPQALDDDDAPAIETPEETTVDDDAAAEEPEEPAEEDAAPGDAEDVEDAAAEDVEAVEDAEGVEDAENPEEEDSDDK
ncbi:cell division protein PerM [Corynebacterium hindlerae]|uniref:cell division protein PerM n=1 Tax=Corynebacterium hindlerae TaxID=699041 RepID=UPI0031B6A610